MDRRLFLTSLGALGLKSCQFPNQSPSLTVSLLSGSISSTLVRQFKDQTNQTIKVHSFKNYAEMLQSLKQNQSSLPDVLGVGDAWLQEVTPWLQPLIPDRIPALSSALAPWYGATQTNPLWAIPYRWGTTVIAYNKNKLKKAGIPPIKQWKDLWNPNLRGRLTLPDSFREVIGLCLKSLGFSYNESSPKAIKQLPNILAQLNEQTLTYTSSYYVQSLVMEDSWVAVGWSEDFVDIVQRYPQIVVTHPLEGTALWTDLFAISSKSTQLEGAYQWINHCLNAQTNKQVAQIDQRAEPIKMLSPQSLKEYNNLWEDLRQKGF